MMMEMESRILLPRVDCDGIHVHRFLAIAEQSEAIAFSTYID